MLLKIDKEKCKQDGQCAADCPIGIIRFDGPGNYPELIPGGENLCIQCGHCVAVCPHGAMDHAEVPLAECPGIDPGLSISSGQAEQFLRSRRSIRQFKAQPVEQAMLQRLIEVAGFAPTASNAQLVTWHVIANKDHLHEISSQVKDWLDELLKGSQTGFPPYFSRFVDAWEAGIDSILRSAPCLVVAMAPPEARNGLVDLTLALSYLELIAPLYGLGACWAGLLQGAIMSRPELKKTVGIPLDYPSHYPMMIGYPAVRYHRLIQRKRPRVSWQ
jgi:nitroreductase/NAD-dependent dihydropyrimidine dehydrogenase PreA subunit